MEEDTKKRVDYTPITQGLREYIERHPTMMHAVGLTDHCDSIDVKYEVRGERCIIYKTKKVPSYDRD